MLPSTGLNCGFDQLRPPGVHQLDRRRFLVDPVAVEVAAVGTRLVPGAQGPHALLQLADCRRADRLEDDRQQRGSRADPGSPLPPSPRRAGRSSSCFLPLVAALHLVGDHLRALQRAVAVVVVGRRPFRRLLVVPGDEVVRVRPPAGASRRAGRRPSGSTGLEALPVVLAGAQHRQVGRGALGPLRVGAGERVGDVLGVDVGPVEGEVDVRDGLLKPATPVITPRVRSAGRTRSPSRPRGSRCCAGCT